MSQMETETNIPIVGQAFKAHEGYVLATITCACRANNAPILIRGTDVAAVCSACGRTFGIIKAEYDAVRGLPLRVTIAQVAQTRTPTPPQSASPQS